MSSAPGPVSSFSVLGRWGTRCPWTVDLAKRVAQVEGDDIYAWAAVVTMDFPRRGSGAYPQQSEKPGLHGQSPDFAATR